MEPFWACDDRAYSSVTKTLVALCVVNGPRRLAHNFHTMAVYVGGEKTLKLTRSPRIKLQLYTETIPCTFLYIVVQTDPNNRRE